MRKIRYYLRKNRLKILLADAAVILIFCVALLLIDKPDKVEGLEITDSTYSTAAVSWKASENAVAYRLYRSEDGEHFKYMTTTTDTSYADSDLQTGKTYYYAVTARNGFRVTKLDKENVAVAKPSLEAPDLKVDTSKGEVRLTFSKVDGATGYEIIRNGEVIAQLEKNEFVDEQAGRKSGEYAYEVRAYINEDKPVYGKVSDTIKAEIHTLQNFAVKVSGEDLLISWDKNEHYEQYSLYNGDSKVGETSEGELRLENFEMDKTYDLRLTGYASDASEQSPVVEKTFIVTEAEMTNEEAIEEAVLWGIDIAEDDSFTYGTGKRAHRHGCYFCQTNTGPRLNKKGSSLEDGHSYEKTYCCNPFVHACFAHGAGDPNMLAACQKGHGVNMDEESYTRYGHWKNMGKLSKSQLKRGDVLVRSSHVMLYIGDGQIVHAASEGWGPNSITVTALGGRNYSFVMRYTGTGRGVKRVIKDVDKPEEATNIQI